MKNKNITTRNKEKGQAMAEYVIMLGMFLGVLMIMILLMAIFTEYGWRILALVAQERP